MSSATRGDIGARLVMIRADSMAGLPLADQTAQCCVTSPPYLAQRTYGGSPNEIGAEPSVAAYVDNIADVLDEVRRVLRPDGLCWLNLGDKANGSGGAGGDWGSGTKPGGPGKFRDTCYETGSFMDVPGSVLAELLQRGWRLRMPVVWSKGREAPESLDHVRRPRWSHEMIFMLAPGRDVSKFYPRRLVETGSVWSFPPGGSGPAHLAPFPDELVRRCVVPSTDVGDVVVDPFAGSGTTVRVARRLGRHGVGVDLYAGVGT